MPHAAFWKFLIELNGFLVSTEWSLIMRSNDHLVGPGNDGNKIFITALCEQLLNLCLGSRRNEMLGNCRYRSMSFLCPSERLFAAKDTYGKPDRDPTELLHTADYNGTYRPTPLSSHSRWRRAQSASEFCQGALHRLSPPRFPRFAVRIILCALTGMIPARSVLAVNYTNTVTATAG